MKTRIIQTKFWDDPELIGASLEASHLYIYLLTSGHIGLAGIFQASDQEILLKSRLTDKQLVKAKKELQELGKVYFYKTWIYVVNAERHNNYGASEKNTKAIDREKSDIPLNILEVFNNISLLDTSIQTSDSSMGGVSDTSDTSHKSIINNHKSEIGVESVREGDFSRIEYITFEDCEEVALSNGVPVSFVLSKKDDLQNWHDKNPRKNQYKNYKAGLKDWVKRDALTIQKEAHGQSKIAYINTEDTGGVNDTVQDQTHQRIGLIDPTARPEPHFEGIGGGG